MSSGEEYLTGPEQELVERSDEFDRARAVAGAAQLACMLGLTPEHTHGFVAAFRLEVGNLDADQAVAVRGHLAGIMATLCQAHDEPAAEELLVAPHEIDDYNTLVEVSTEPSMPLRLQSSVERAVAIHREVDVAQKRGLTQAAQSVLHEVFGDTTALFGDEVGVTGVSEDDAAVIARTIMRLHGPIQVRPIPARHEARLKAFFDGCEIKTILESTGEPGSPSAAYMGIHNIVKKITSRADFSQTEAYTQLVQAIGVLEPIEVVEVVPPSLVEEPVQVYDEVTGSPESDAPKYEADFTRLLQKVITLLTPEAKQHVTEDMAINEFVTLVSDAYATLYASDGHQLLDCYLEYVTHEQPLKELVKKYQVSYDDAGKLVAMMPGCVARLANERYAQVTPPPTPLAMPPQKTLTYQPPRAHHHMDIETTALPEDEAAPAIESVPVSREVEQGEPTPLALAALKPHETEREEWIRAARTCINNLSDYGYTPDEVQAIWCRMHHNKRNEDITGDTVIGLRKLHTQLSAMTETALPSEATEKILSYFLLGGENNLGEIHKKVKRTYPEVEEPHVERHVAAGIEAIMASYAPAQS